MSESQETIVEIISWFGVAVLLVVVWTTLFSFVKVVESLFRKSHEANGEDQQIPFSEVTSMGGYIPQVNSNWYSFPLVACDTEGFTPELFDWLDPDRPYLYYDLTADAKELIGDMDCVKDKHVFSIVSHERCKRRRRKHEEVVDEVLKPLEIE